MVLPTRDKVPKYRLPEGDVSQEFGRWLETLDELVRCDSPDAILRRAVEVARARIGLQRSSIFLRDEPNGLMRGSWGTDATGSIVDEHFITFDITPNDPELFEEAARRGAYWVVVDDAPLVTHSQDETHVIGSGWVCCTSIRVAPELFGIMYNDAGLAPAKVDTAKQEQTALLCSLAGAALEHARRRGFEWLAKPTRVTSPALAKAMRLLEQNPGLTAEELSTERRLSASRVARLFKAEMGISLVEYRNGLRLDRFTRLLDDHEGNLLEAALAAGFGSYAQFYRVFVAQRGPPLPATCGLAPCARNDKRDVTNERTRVSRGVNVPPKGRNMHGDSKHWLIGGLLSTLSCVGTGCTTDSESSSANPDNGSRAGSSSTAEGGATTMTNGGAGGDGGSGSTTPAPTFPVGSLDPLAAPPTGDVAQPSASGSEPNLRVLPWAGFAAALSYTFDDTQPSQAEHWDELEATGIGMTFFANPSSNWQSGFDATWTAVAAAGSEIGNHTWNHCHSDLSDCTPVGTAEEEIDEATEYIIEHFGVPAVLSFASPYGDSGWNAYAASRFLVGRGVASGFVAATGASNWHNLPVIAVDAGETADDFNAAIDSAYSQGRWGIFMFHSILPTSNNWYAGVEMTDIATSIDYAQGLENVWIERMGVVGAYVRAQQMFEAVTPSDNVWTWTLPERYPTRGVLRVTVDGGSLSQNGTELTWDPHGYYEVSLDAGQLSWNP